MNSQGTVAPGTVRLTGLLGERAELAVAQLVASTPYSVPYLLQDVILDPTQRRENDDYCGDLSGRWLEASVYAAGIGLAVDPTKQDDVLEGVLDAQQPDGSFGPGRAWTDTDHGVVWGNGRLLMGLLAQRQRLAQPGSRVSRARLEWAIQALTTHLVTVTPLWLRWFADDVSRKTKFALDLFSILQPLALLAAERHDARRDGPNLMTAVEDLVAAVPLRPDQPYHTHGYLLALRGALSWHTHTGNDQGIRDIYRAYLAVEQKALMPNGTTRETLASAGDLNTEGCGVADWLMLSLELHTALGYEHLLVEANHVAVNGLPHMQSPSGHFGCETISSDPGIITDDYCTEAWWCCTLHCLLAITAFAHKAVVLEDDQLEIRFLHGLQTVIPAGSGPLGVSIRGDFPWETAITIELDSATPIDVVVRPHVPSAYRVARNSATDGRISAGAASIAASVNGNLSIPLLFEPLTWVKSGTTAFQAAVPSATDATNPLAGKRIAVFEGAVLMAADGRANNPADVVRGRRVLLHERRGSFAPLPRDGELRGVVAQGYSVQVELVLRPLATALGNDGHLVRIEFDEVIVVSGDA